LASSIAVEKHNERNYAVVTKAQNVRGYGYGAPQEFGWKRSRGNKSGKKVKGKHYIVRATFGMIKRWQRGERWKD